MQYTRLGHSGLIVSRLAFGVMTFGSDPSQPAIYKVNRENAKAMIDKALDAGINLFDTADLYAGGQIGGYARRVVGQAAAPRGDCQQGLVLGPAKRSRTLGYPGVISWRRVKRV
jgi:aryl-alcohol dehydrogenase-like predicted oxidoreductase